MTFDQDLQDFSKSVVESRTLWISVLAPLIISLAPPLAPLIAANPVASAWIAGAVMAGLRLATSKAVRTPIKKKSAQSN